MNMDDFNQIEKQEEPTPIVSDKSILQTITPAITTFNKKTIIFIGVIMVVVLLLTAMAVMTPQKIKPNKGEIESDGNKNINLNTPDAINKIPGTYLGRSFNLLSPDTKNNKVDTDDLIFKMPTDYQPDQRGNSGGKNDIFGNEISATEQEAINARKSSIRFINSSLSSNSNKRNSNNDVIEDQINKLNSLTSKNGDKKENFYESNSSTPFYTKQKGLREPLSTYEVKAGGIIPVTLITGINSDLPGFIIAQVRINIYDTITGRHLLIPQGTKVMGVYDSNVIYAQNRLLVSWTRLILPNGMSLALEGMEGADTAGYAGFKDKVNNHWKKIIGGALITSMLGAGSQMLSSTEDENDYYSIAASGAAESLSNAGTKIFEKSLNIQPTIEIRPGHKFNIVVDRDLIIEKYKEQ